MKKLILPIIYITAMIVLSSYVSSCSTMQTTYKPNYEYLKNHKNQYEWTCSKF